MSCPDRLALAAAAGAPAVGIFPEQTPQAAIAVATATAVWVVRLSCCRKATLPAFTLMLKTSPAVTASICEEVSNRGSAFTANDPTATAAAIARAGTTVVFIAIFLKNLGRLPRVQGPFALGLEPRQRLPRPNKRPIQTSSYGYGCGYGHPEPGLCCCCSTRQ